MSLDAVRAIGEIGRGTLPISVVNQLITLKINDLINMMKRSKRG